MVDRRVKVTLDGDIGPFARAMAAASAEAKAFSGELDTSTDRVANLTQSVLALGPALVPISAAAVPAMAGLANQLGIGAAAVGVSVLAFKGLGKALTAVNNASIEPTAANLQKMHDELGQLGPAGRDFVLFLQNARPELQHLQELARQGLLPGLEQGVKSLTGLLPDVERIITTVSSTLGDLASEAGANLDSPKWHEFIAFLESEARPTLLAMGRTAGNFAEGLANLWMAFAPLENNFSQAFLGLSRDFAKWTDGLDKTQGFQDFMAYVDEVGPEVWDTLGSLANALLQIVEAAAPVGRVTLPVIKALADAVATLADSNLGPLIIGVVALASAFSRLKAIGIAANSGALGGLLSRSGYTGLGATLKTTTQATNTLRAAQEKLAASSVAARDAQFALVPVGSQRQALRSYMSDLRDLRVAETEAAAASRARNVQFGRLGAGAALLGVTMTGLDKKMHLTNTTSLAMAGSLAGPWGTAIGAGVGLALDFAHANDNISAAMHRAKDAVDQNQVSLRAQKEAIDAVKTSIDTTNRVPVGGGQAHAINTVGAAARNKKDLADLEAQYDKNKAKAEASAFAEAGLAAQMANASKATRDETFAMLENVKAKNAAADATENAFSAETNYRQALKDAEKQARTNNAGINGSSDAALKNRGALDTLATAWNRVADSGAATSDDMKKARANFIAAAESMGVSTKVARELAKELLHLPSPKVTVSVTDDASPVITEIIRGLGKLHDKTITIRTNKETHVSTLTGGGRTATNKADGGYITGPGGPRDDLIPAMLSNGEFVVNAAATRRFLPDLHRINAQKFADGGQVLQRMAPTGYLAPAAYGNSDTTASHPLVLDGVVVGTLHVIAGRAARIEVANAAEFADTLGRQP